MVEIDQAVVDVSKEYLPQMAIGLEDPRCTLIIDDCMNFMNDPANHGAAPHHDFLQLKLVLATAAS